MHFLNRDSALAEDKNDLIKFCNAQNQQLSAIAESILALPPEQGGKMVVITETIEQTWQELLEQELDGKAPTQEVPEALRVVPRVFLRHLFASAKSVQEKDDIVAKNKKSFNATPAMTYQMRNNVRWVVGDRDRDLTVPSFVVIRNWWHEILTNPNENGGDLIQSLTIDFVINYIKDLSANCKRHGITEHHSDTLLKLLTMTVESKKVSPNDNLAHFYKYMPDDVGCYFNDQLIQLTHHIFNIELKRYIQAFEADDSLTILYVITGDVHTNYMKQLLLNRGYSVEKTSGVTVYKFIQACEQKSIQAVIHEAQQSPADLSLEYLGIKTAQQSQPSRVQRCLSWIRSCCSPRKKVNHE